MICISHSSSLGILFFTFIKNSNIAPTPGNSKNLNFRGKWSQNHWIQPKTLEMAFFPLIASVTFGPKVVHHQISNNRIKVRNDVLYIRYKQQSDSDRGSSYLQWQFKILNAVKSNIYFRKKKEGIFGRGDGWTLKTFIILNVLQTQCKQKKKKEKQTKWKTSKISNFTKFFIYMW